MIYTVTFNPAIDYLMRVGEIKVGITNRSEYEEMHFGGKGINVSAVLAELGAPTTALGFVAGFTGEALEKAVCDRGINGEFIRLAQGHTRINVKLKGDHETEINAAGPHIPPEAVDTLFEKVAKLKKGDTLILAGSIPASLPTDVYQKMADIIPSGVRLVVDATKKLLLNSLEYKPFLIKPNRQELEEIFEKPMENDDDIIFAARELKKMGAKNVLVSLGGDGAILLDDKDNVYRQPAFKVTAINTVGSGDSMIAGFIFGYDEKGAEYGLLLGSAAGAATASLSGLATKKAIYEILNRP